jgi:hypothetical protein
MARGELLSVESDQFDYLLSQRGAIGERKGKESKNVHLASRAMYIA